MKHNKPHDFENRIVIVNYHDTRKGFPPEHLEFFLVRDWSDRVFSKPWGELDKSCEGNKEACEYGFRAGASGIPPDNSVLFGYLIPLSSHGELQVIIDLNECIPALIHETEIVEKKEEVLKRPKRIMV